MAIEKRFGKDGKPAYRVRIAVHDSVSGKRRNVTEGTYRTRRDAERAERDALQKRDRGTLLDPATTTVAELLEAWLATKSADVTAQTLKGYEITIRRHLVPALGSIRVQRLTPDRLQAQYAEWLEGGMSARNIRGCHMRLSQALDQAIRFRLLPSNVCNVVSPPRLPKPKPAVWSTEEIIAFLQVAQHDSLSPLWHLLVLEGLRRGEALGLRWQDINWNRCTAHIVQTVAPDISSRGEPIIQARTKTAAGARTVKLSDATLTALKTCRTQWLSRKRASETWADHDLIICTTRDARGRPNGGKPINPNNVTRSFELLIERAALPRITPHGLRHSHATMLLRKGVSAKIVSERLGHASIGITLDTYSHVLPDMQDTAAQAVDAILATTRDQSD